MVTYEFSSLKLLVQFLLPHPYLSEVVLCTILKRRSLRACVVLVVFCCSLVAACISPVWADTTSGDPNSFAVYASFTGGPDPASGTSPIVLPFSGHHLFHSFTPDSGTSLSLRPMVHVPEIVPVDFERTFVLDLGFQGHSITVTSENLYNYANVTWYSSSYQSQTYSKGAWISYQNMLAPNGLNQVYRCIIPANATGFRFTTPNKFVFTGAGKSVGLASFGGYVVDTSDQDIVDTVADILKQVTQINSTTADMHVKLNSCLTTLNFILGQCKNLNADTDTIITILNAVESQLVTLNGKVDDIYTLLKDSLKTESSAVDKKSQELGEQIMQRVDSEQFWSDKNTETFNSLDMGNFTFGDGVVGALPTVGNLFKSLWDSFGEVTLIFTFPLMLGIALVIVGRISRTSGRGSKKGGDDS